MVETLLDWMSWAPAVCPPRLCHQLTAHNSSFLSFSFFINKLIILCCNNYDGKNKEAKLLSTANCNRLISLYLNFKHKDDKQFTQLYGYSMCIILLSIWGNRVMPMTLASQTLHSPQFISHKHYGSALLNDSPVDTVCLCRDGIIREIPPKKSRNSRDPDIG